MSGEPRLPPGQALTRKFPVVGERAPAPGALDLATWRLEVSGLVARPLQLDWPGYLALPRRERTVDLHCVTGWSRLGTRLGGLPLAQLLEAAGVLPGARFVRFAAYSERDHDTSLPLDLARRDTWLVHEVDGLPLAVEHGFPLRTVTPSRYFYKSLKWLRRIELAAEDRLGYWERESAYHNVGDPWAGDQRFTTGSADPAEVARFRAARDFAPWRSPRKVLLGVELAGWRPATTDLRGLRLKNCDLRGARLAGCDLAGANLSLSDLRGADLAGARLAGADLEGARLAGADLAGADLTGCALSATSFFEPGADARPARLAGLRLAGASGLLEDQERWLRAHGVALAAGAPAPEGGDAALTGRDTGRGNERIRGRREAAMLRIRKILFPTDFSPAGRPALDEALLWAEVHGAELLLLHVLSLRTADPLNPEHHFPETEALFARLHELASTEMASLVAAHRERPFAIRETIQAAPEVDRGILDFAEEQDVDLVVMGTHGRRGPAHLLFGSIATEVLRRSPRPVLVVPSRGERPAGRLRRVLAPVDFSVASRFAVDHARVLAGAAGATLELFHVLPDLEVPLPMNPAGLGASATVVTDLEPAAESALAELVAAPGADCRIETRVWHGPPAATILNRAEETGADLIVIASHGHTGLDRLLLGSVAERVARLASCPVLVLPPHGRSLLPGS